MLHLFLQFIIYLMHELDIFFVNLFLPQFCPILKYLHWKYLKPPSEIHLNFSIFGYFRYKNFLQIHVGGIFYAQKALKTKAFCAFLKSI